MAPQKDTKHDSNSPMSKDHKEVLLNCRTVLVENLDIRDIKDFLIEKKVITRDMYERICLSGRRGEQVSDFLDLLTKRGDKAFYIFLESLKETYDFLYNDVQRCRNRKAKPRRGTNEHYYFRGADILEMYQSAPRPNPISSIQSYMSNATRRSSYPNTYAKYDVTRSQGQDGGSGARLSAVEIDPYAIPRRKSSAKDEQQLQGVIQEEEGEEETFAAVILRDIKVQIYDPETDVSNSLHGSSCEKNISECNLSDVIEELFHDIESEDTVLTQATNDLKVTQSAPPEENPKSGEIDEASDDSIVVSEDMVTDNGVRKVQPNGPLLESPGSKQDANTSGRSMLELKTGDIVIVEHKEFQHTTGSHIKVHDLNGQTLLVPPDCFKRYDDPTGEPWYFPVPLNNITVEVMLRKQSIGTFIFYKKSDTSPYHMSLVCQEEGKVEHFKINKYRQGSYGFNEEKTFPSLHELQVYHKYNRGVLPCRLRRTPSNAPMELDVKGMFLKEKLLEYKHLSIEPEGYIGRGISGQVKKGTYKEEPIAAKSLQFTDLPTYEVEDFLEEAKTMLELNHENIILCQGVCISEDMDVSIVMDLCDKRDIRHCLKTGTLTAEANGQQFFDFFKGIISALEYLKSKHVVHRDIATRNLFLNSMDTVKLGDFGMARHVEDDFYRAEESEPVPLHWAPPEVLGELWFSSKSDIYSAGVTLWEMYSNGEKPYQGLSRLNVTEAIASGQHLVKPCHCPMPVYNLMMACWAYEAVHRPSAHQLRKKINSQSYYVNYVIQNYEMERCTGDMEITGDGDASLNLESGILTDHDSNGTIPTRKKSKEEDDEETSLSSFNGVIKTENSDKAKKKGIFHKLKQKIKTIE